MLKSRVIIPSETPLQSLIEKYKLQWFNNIVSLHYVACTLRNFMALWAVFQRVICGNEKLNMGIPIKHPLSRRLVPGLRTRSKIKTRISDPACHFKTLILSFISWNYFFSPSFCYPLHTNWTPLRTATLPFSEIHYEFMKPFTLSSYPFLDITCLPRGLEWISTKRQQENCKRCKSPESNFWT
jgi:hypothetical protein